MREYRMERIFDTLSFIIRLNDSQAHKPVYNLDTCITKRHSSSNNYLMTTWLKVP